VDLEIANALGNYTWLGSNSRPTPRVGDQNLVGQNHGAVPVATGVRSVNC